jgi:hypothetical protein
MMKTPMIALAAMAALAASSALAADGTLLSLVPSDAKVVAGVRVTTVKASPFGQFVLSRLHPDGQEAFQKLMAATGFDPRRDVSEIIMATNSTPGAGMQGIVVVHGVFDPARIQSAATAHGCTASTVMGVALFTAGDSNGGALALPDATTAMLGDVESVKAAIGRYRSKAKPGDDLQKRVQAASQDASGTANDFWFVTLVPLSELAPRPPEGSANGAPQMNAFQSVQQASGGARFTADNVSLAAQLVMRSDKDAQSMADVIRFLAGMLQQNHKKDTTAAGTVASLLTALTINTTANVTQVALVLPEAQVEQLLNTLQQHEHRHAENRPPRGN